MCWKSKKESCKKIPLMSVLSVGNSDVGKTAILQKYLKDIFTQEMTSTIGQEFYLLERNFCF